MTPAIKWIGLGMALTLAFLFGATLTYVNEVPHRRACLETHDLLMEVLDRSSKRSK